jgi:hypothetical protein
MLGYMLPNPGIKPISYQRFRFASYFDAYYFVDIPIQSDSPDRLPVS